MLIKSGLVTQISGSFGGMTGSHNRGGMYLRARSIPVDPATTRQQIMRTAASSLTSRWRDTLTQSQRDAWAVYAANTPITSPLGDPRDVGALPMYVRGNSVRIQIGAAVIDDPAVSGLPELSQQESLAIASSTGLLTGTIPADPWVDIDDAWLAIYASRPLSESIGFYKGPYRLLGSVEGDSVTAPTNFNLSYSDQWGDVAVGSQVRMQFRVVDEFGALSAPIRQSVVVTA